MEIRMRVMITGIAGFLGTHVAEYFKSEGWEVCGIDNLTDYELERAKFDVTKSRDHNLKFLQSLGVQFYIGDCVDVCAGKLLDLFGRIDLIIHCAAQPAMTIALEDPIYDAQNNILATINMIEVAKKLKCPFANCSSVHVYGNSSNNDLKIKGDRFVSKKPTINEDTPILMGEITPLHISKLACELHTSIADVPAANFRFTGMYGERQFGGMDHGWVANFAIRTIMEKEITIFGTDKQVRDILYAKDAARVFKCWWDAGCPRGTFNVGGGMYTSISLSECLRMLSKITGKSSISRVLPKRAGDLWYFVCDYEKAKKTLNWEPKIAPDLGLSFLCDWIEKNKELFK